MLHRSLRIRMRQPLFAAALLAKLAHGAESADVVATFCRDTHTSPEKCSELKALKSDVPGLKDEDFVYLEAYLAKRLSEGLDSAAGKTQQALLDAAWLSRLYAQGKDRQVGHTPSTSALVDQTKIDALLKKVDLAKVGDRKLEPQVLLNVVDSLCGNNHLEEATIVFGLVSSEHTAPVALGRGILLMKQEPHDEAGARAAFREAVKLDPSASLPKHAEQDPKVLELFNEVKSEPKSPVTNDVPTSKPVSSSGTASRTVPPLPDPSQPRNLPWKNGWQLGGLATGIGGVALLGVGTGMGIGALIARGDADRFANNGDQKSYDQAHQSAIQRSIWGDILSSAGGIALAAGACLYWFGPGGAGYPSPDQASKSSGTAASVGIGVHQGQIALTVGGHF